jgi:hypothetical protein
MSDYKKHNHIGPGGIKCPCCVPFSVKKTRKWINRITRRASKIALKMGEENKTEES